MSSDLSVQALSIFEADKQYKEKAGSDVNNVTQGLCMLLVAQAGKERWRLQKLLNLFTGFLLDSSVWQTSLCSTDCFNVESAVPAAGLTFQLRYHVCNTINNPWMPWMYLKARLMQWDLKRGHFAYTLPCCSTVTGGLCQSSLRVVFSDPFALGAALALDAAFNLRICGNREDFLSTDPLAPCVRNPLPFSHTALVTWIEASRYTAAVSVGARTHTHMRLGLPDTHTPPPKLFVSQGIYYTTVIIVTARDI